MILKIREVTLSHLQLQIAVEKQQLLNQKFISRVISYKYMYTLKKDSIWRKADRWSYLEKVLKNNESDHPTVKYTYEFTVGDYKD